MKEVDFEKQDFNKIIHDTENSLKHVSPITILKNYENEFCEK